jgi:predicted DNA-binding transcriptional regulator YafY
MSQRQQLERIFEIDRQIRVGLYPNADKLAQELECSRRVIFKDREFMLDRLDAPIEYDRERGGWYYSDPTWVLPSISVSEGELLAFLLSIEVAQRHLGTALESSLRSAIEKISKRLKGPIAVDLGALRSHYSVAEPTTAIMQEQALLDLYRAIQVQRPVRIRYYTNKRGEWNERTINPHHLYNENGAWYVFAFDHLRQEMRNFHIGRMEWWQVLDDKFEWQTGFSPQDWVAHSFQGIHGEKLVEVAIKFDEYQARWIREQRWPESYEIEELADRELILRFQTGGLDGVMRWVMQYGRHAEVLAPLELRAQVAEEHRLAGGKYKD